MKQIQITGVALIFHIKISSNSVACVCVWFQKVIWVVESLWFFRIFF
jgi:hypothetical protein